MPDFPSSISAFRSCVLLSLIAAAQLIRVTPASAVEDIEFVQEHLAEVPMDNRFATLPLWSGVDESARWQFTAQAAYARTGSGKLTVEGQLLSLAASRHLANGWSFGACGFVDEYSLRGDNDLRPLQTLFAPQTPLARPVDARFDNLDGDLRHLGVAMNISKSATGARLGAHRWIAGVLWQRIELSDYALDYRILKDPDTGVTGTIDFDGTYRHVTPFVGLEFPRQHGQWEFNSHALFARPFPRRSIIGHITGPGFDIHGNTEAAGNGKHFGDQSLTLGFDVTWTPAHLTFGLGTAISQRLLEPAIHPGIESNWLLNLQLNY